MKPTKSNIQTYERIGTLTLEEGFKLIAAEGRSTTINGVEVTTNSLRLRSFLQNGVKCAHPGCPFEGSYFAIEMTPPGRSATANRKYHLNLWGVDHEDNQPVLMTVDHIIAKALGGLDELQNTQTMCCWHNWRKGSKEGTVALEKTRKQRIESAPLKFTYVGQKNTPHVRAVALTVRRTFNFFLNDPLTWDTEAFLDIIWKHAGFCCIEVRLVDNSYRHPIHGKLSHRYDLYFITGKGLIEEGDVNKVMRKIEYDIRKKLDVFMPDTHFVIDGEDDGLELVMKQGGR
jgi:hypothetical protein